MFLFFGGGEDGRRSSLGLHLALMTRVQRSEPSFFESLELPAWSHEGTWAGDWDRLPTLNGRVTLGKSPGFSEPWFFYRVGEGKRG